MNENENVNSEEIDTSITTNNLFRQFIAACKSRYERQNDVDILRSVSFAKHLFMQAKKSELKSDTCRRLIQNCLKIAKDFNSSKELIYNPLLELVTFLNQHKDEDEKSQLNQSKKIDKNLTEKESNKEKSDNDVKTKEEVKESFETKKVKPTTSKNTANNFQEENKSNNQNDDDNDEDYAGLSAKDKKQLKKIKKLDEFCMRLNQKIIELESKELSDNELDSENSNYIVEGKLKRKFNMVYTKLINLMKKNKHLIDPDIKPKKNVGGVFSFRIKFNFTRYNEVNQIVEENLNKTKMFPDYIDVVEWIKQADKQYDLGFDDRRVNELGKEVLKEIGRIIKERRKNEDKLIAKSRIDSLRKLEPKNETSSDQIDEMNQDPADEDSNLEQKLQDNYQKAIDNEKKIIEEFVQKQNNDLDFEVKTDEEEDDDYDQNTEDNQSVEFEIENDLEPSQLDLEDLVPGSQELDPKEPIAKTNGDDTINDVDLEEEHSAVREKSDQPTTYESPELTLEETVYKTTLDISSNTTVSTISKDKNSSTSSELIFGRRTSLKRSANESEETKNNGSHVSNKSETDSLEKRPVKRLNLNDDNKSITIQTKKRTSNDDSELNELELDIIRQELDKEIINHKFKNSNNLNDSSSNFNDDCIVLD